jgi:hypothetical protein
MPGDPEESGSKELNNQRKKAGLEMTLPFLHPHFDP